MAEFIITFKNERQHRVQAHDREHALEVWLDEQGYDSIEEAAKEYFGVPGDFGAIRVGF